RGRRVATGLRGPRVREVDADDRRLREAVREPERTGTRPGTDVEDARRRAGHSFERSVVRRERVLEPHRVPDGCDRVELPAHERTEEPPQDRAAHGGIGRHSCKPSADRRAIDHDGSRWMRTSRPGLSPSMAAALPPLIAIDRFRYESS